MEYKYVTDLRHLLSEDHAAERSIELEQLRKHLGKIVKAASAIRDTELVSALPCRKRCSGRLLIRRQDIPESALVVALP